MNRVLIAMIFNRVMITIINWVVRALSTDWLTAVVYQTVFFYCSNYVGNQFIIAIRHLWGL